MDCYVWILPTNIESQGVQGMLVKKPHDTNKRKEVYVLTEKGLDVIPLLLEMAD
ncbi:MAG: hypothetical protein ACJ788_23450 [Ktedonobacteraceae bacterium]|jgi:DNA-binding HxlR family transcriptional regulator